MAYLLDSNIFIQAKNLHYGMDFCPGFWDWLVKANDNGRVFSIEKIENELVAGDDDLAKWARERGQEFFLPPDEKMTDVLPEVSAWVKRQKYQESAHNLFFQSADYYLISYAKAHGHAVVTHEILSDSARKIKIPNVCIGMQVRCLTPFEMLRLEKVRLVLKES